MPRPDSPPRLLGGRPTAGSAVLVLHGGQDRNTSPSSRRQLAYLRMLDFYWGLRRQQHNCAVYLLSYRRRGWNAGPPDGPDPVQDAAWALDQVRDRHGHVPVALLGHSMGGRAAFAVAGDPDVVGVCGLAPWLPDAEPLPAALDRRRFVIAHGTWDLMTSAPLSRSYAHRLREMGGCVARYELPRGRHSMLTRVALWNRFAVSTTLGLVGDRSLPQGVATGLHEEGAQGLAIRLTDFDKPHAAP